MLLLVQCPIFTTFYLILFYNITPHVEISVTRNLCYIKLLLKEIVSHTYKGVKIKTIEYSRVLCTNSTNNSYIQNSHHVLYIITGPIQSYFKSEKYALNFGKCTARAYAKNNCNSIRESLPYLSLYYKEMWMI